MMTMLHESGHIGPGRHLAWGRDSDRSGQRRRGADGTFPRHANGRQQGKPIHPAPPTRCSAW